MKRPTDQEREQLRNTVERVRRQRSPPAPAAADVEGAGLVHDLTAESCFEPNADLHCAMRGRVLEIDAYATIRGGERADDLRRNLGRMGFERGFRP